MNQVDTISVGQHVTVSGKVIRLNEPLPIQKKSAEVLTIQESIFGDVTRQIRLVSWGNQNRQLAIDKCYKLDNVTVQIYNEVKYLSISSATLITPIDDTGP